MFHALAKIFRLLHYAIGLTTLPHNASPSQERTFVLMWLAIIVGIVLWLAVLLYLLR
jgi:hypothetical protein